MNDDQPAQGQRTISKTETVMSKNTNQEPILELDQVALFAWIEILDAIDKFNEPRSAVVKVLPPPRIEIIAGAVRVPYTAEYLEQLREDAKK